MSDTKQYGSLDEVREGVRYECDCAFDDVLASVIKSPLAEHPEPLEFTIKLDAQLIQQIRRLATPRA